MDYGKDVITSWKKQIIDLLNDTFIHLWNDRYIKTCHFFQRNEIQDNNSSERFFLFTNSFKSSDDSLSMNIVSCLWRHFYHSIVALFFWMSKVSFFYIIFIKYFIKYSLRNFINSTIKFIVNNLLIFVKLWNFHWKLSLKTKSFPDINKLSTHINDFSSLLWNFYKLAKYFKRLS